MKQKNYTSSQIAYFEKQCMKDMLSKYSRVKVSFLNERIEPGLINGLNFIDIIMKPHREFGENFLNSEFQWENSKEKNKLLTMLLEIIDLKIVIQLLSPILETSECFKTLEHKEMKKEYLCKVNEVEKVLLDDVAVELYFRYPEDRIFYSEYIGFNNTKDYKARVKRFINNVLDTREFFYDKFFKLIEDKKDSEDQCDYYQNAKYNNDKWNCYHEELIKRIVKKYSLNKNVPIKRKTIYREIVEEWKQTRDVPKVDTIYADFKRYKSVIEMRIKDALKLK